jgi:hypothetical protein
MTLRITGFLDFVHCPESEASDITMSSRDVSGKCAVRKCDEA